MTDTAALLSAVRSFQYTLGVADPAHYYHDVTIKLTHGAWVVESKAHGAPRDHDPHIGRMTAPTVFTNAVGAHWMAFATPEDASEAIATYAAAHELLLAPMNRDFRSDWAKLPPIPSSDTFSGVLAAAQSLQLYFVSADGRRYFVSAWYGHNHGTYAWMVHSTRYGEDGALSYTPDDPHTGAMTSPMEFAPAYNWGGADLHRFRGATAAVDALQSYADTHDLTLVIRPPKITLPDGGYVAPTLRPDADPQAPLMRSVMMTLPMNDATPAKSTRRRRKD